MAIQTIEGGFWCPHAPAIDSSVAISSTALDAANEQLGLVFQAPKTGNIATVSFDVTTVTTSGDIDVRLETVDVSGDPSGTLVSANANVSFTVSSTGWTTATFTSSAAVTKGDIIAAVITADAASVPNIQIRFRWGGDFEEMLFPYLSQDLGGGGWSPQSDPALWAIGYDDGTYAAMPGCYPCESVDVSIINTNTSPDELGIIFQFPFDVRVTGCWMGMDTEGNDIDIVLYDSDGSTALLTQSLDGDYRAKTGRGLWGFAFNSVADLNANTNYRLVIKPTTTSNVTVLAVQTASAAHFDAWDGGQEIHQTGRANAGSWTETTNARPMMGLICSGFSKSTQGLPAPMGNVRIPSGVVDQFVYFKARDANDLTTEETGLSSFTVYRSRNGAAAAVMTTPTINEVDSTNMPGVYELLVDEDTTIDAGNHSEAMVFYISHAGMAPVDLQIELYDPLSALTTQMTEAYAADGVAPTPAQALFMIMQQAGEFAISGTTITVKKLDGSTTAATFTMDDATNPTSRTRAT